MVVTRRLAYLLMLIITSLITAYLLLAWFKKDILVEYRGLMPGFLKSWLRIEEYREVTQSDPKASYPKFLLEYSDHGFFLRLINCEICLSVWISTFLYLLIFTAGVILGSPWYTLALAFPYGMASAFASLLMYFTLIKLISNGDSERRP